MQALEAFLSDLRRRDIRLERDGENLRYSAPEGALTSDLLRQLQVRKPEILSFLHQAQLASCRLSSRIRALPRDPTSPASFAQRRLWLVEQLGLVGRAYYMPVVLRLSGCLDAAALARSFQELIWRHEALRTVFREEQGEPVQVVLPRVDFTLPLEDLRQLTAAAQEAEIQRACAAERAHPFDLSQTLPIQATLLQLGPTEHVLAVTFHHIACDGLSTDIFAHELSGLYSAFVAREPSPLLPLPVQYADFAIWQRQSLQDEQLEIQLAYWKKQLSAFSPLQLTTDHPRPAVETFRGAGVPFRICKRLYTALQALSQQQDVTLFMTLLTTFQVLLQRYTGQTRITVGSPIANRTQSETESLMGCFVNALALCTDFSGDPPFLQALDRVREVTLGAYAHQDLPFERLVETLQPVRDLGRNPLFQVVFALQPKGAITPVFHLRGLQVLVEGLRPVTARTDLECHIWQDGTELQGLWLYNTDLFERATIQRMVDHWWTLLRAVVAQPSQPLSQLPLLTPAERRQILTTWNETASADPIPFFQDIFETQVNTAPAAIAVAFNHHQISYQELHERSNQLAHYLCRLGVGPETMVGLYMERGLEVIVGFLGILKAGGCYVPLDPAQPVSRLAFIISDCHLSVLITKADMAQPLPSRDYLQVVLLDDLTSLLSGEQRTPPESELSFDNLAYLMYTSGSSGDPKGAILTHLGLGNLTRAHQDYGIWAQDRMLQLAPLAFDVSVFEIVLTLSAGATLVLGSREALMPGPQLVDLLRSQRVSVVATTPSILAALPQTELLDLRTLIIGAEVCPPDLIVYWSAGRRLFNGYGPTEITVQATLAPCRRPECNATIGKPFANMNAYILDAHLNPLPIGAPGELCMGGAGVGRGYLNCPALTAAAFVPDPYCGRPGARLYRTGDLTRFLPDGNIEFLGRIDQQVKIRGVRIEPGEIEAQLRRHPAVKETAITVRTGPSGDQRLVGYIVPEPNYPTPDGMDQTFITQQVTSWQALFDHTLSQPQEALSDPLFNTAGWRHSHDGSPIAMEQMRIWAEDIVSQILTLKPQRVLEIGCGSGILLFHLAGHCEFYHGTDFSRASLDYVRQQLAQRAGVYAHVTLSQQPAHDFTALDAGAFDLVILNSVIQYFPSVEYLLDVLEGCLSSLSPGGRIFLGDVRNLRLLQALHISLHLDQAKASDTVAQVQQRLQDQLLQERELLLDPAFFPALQDRFPQISQVQIRLQRGRAHNELNRFRYAVWLCTGPPPPALPEPERLEGSAFSLSDIRHYLATRQPAHLALTNLPNARLSRAVQSLALLTSEDRATTVQDLRRILAESPTTGLDPEALWDLGDALSYQVAIGWAEHGCEGQMEAIFWRQDIGGSVLAPTSHARWSPHLQKWSAYANDPLLTSRTQYLLSQLRRYLEERLPTPMVPSDWVVLKTLPRSSNGKLNRRALPELDASRQLVGCQIVEPSLPAETALENLFVELLGVGPISVNENFFTLGGHSLLAVRLVARIRETLGVDLPLRRVFETPTIAGMAQWLQPHRLDQASACPDLPSCLWPIQAQGVKRPLFLAPPLAGSPLCYVDLARYLDPEQPIYGFQAPGLVDHQSPLTRVEAMAALYITAMRGVQPTGPYLLGGWSLGATIAYEMARQLEREQQDVTFLALIDGGVPRPEDRVGIWRLPYELGRLTCASVKSVWATKTAVTYADLRRLAQWVGLSLPESWGDLSKRSTKEKVTFMQNLMSGCGRSSRVLLCHSLAAMRYRPGAYGGSAILFQTQRPAAMADTLLNDLRPLIAGGIEPCEVPGDHMTLMLDRAHVETLGQRLHHRLSKAQDTTANSGHGR